MGRYLFIYLLLFILMERKEELMVLGLLLCIGFSVLLFKFEQVKKKFKNNSQLVENLENVLIRDRFLNVES